MEGRLQEKGEALLEKELILEELSSLAGRLREQAGEGRQDTLDLAKKVRIFFKKLQECVFL